MQKRGRGLSYVLCKAGVGPAAGDSRCGHGICSLWAAGESRAGTGETGQREPHGAETNR